MELPLGSSISFQKISVFFSVGCSTGVSKGFSALALAQAFACGHPPQPQPQPVFPFRFSLTR